LYTLAYPWQASAIKPSWCAYYICMYVFMCVCVCHEVQLVAQLSFLPRLNGEFLYSIVKSVAVSRGIDLFIQRWSDSSNKNHVIFAMFCRFVRKPFEIAVRLVIIFSKKNILWCFSMEHQGMLLTLLKEHESTLVDAYRHNLSTSWLI